MKGMLIVGGISALIIAVLGWQLNNRIEEVGLLTGKIEDANGELEKAEAANQGSQDTIDELLLAKNAMVDERAANAKLTAKILAERDRKFRKAIRERDIARSKTHDILYSTESCAAYSSIIVADACSAIANELRERALGRPSIRENEDREGEGGSVPATPIPTDGPDPISTLPIG